ncbi:MAG: cellulase N-terminal Ig-like domain-containing protein, partial [Phenylobacterium sp.]|nr:cellulase N-terminal Ig-like domain-containing protein [Phenylobacterium sp.]
MTPKTRLLAAAAALACLPPATATAQNLNVIRLNQAGFETHGPKTATVPNPSRQPLDWRVLDEAGRQVAEGRTSVFGEDAASGEHVQAL